MTKQKLKLLIKLDEIKDPLEDQTQGGDSTDNIITLFQDIFQPILDEFKELIWKAKTKRTLSVA